MSKVNDKKNDSPPVNSPETMLLDFLKKNKLVLIVDSVFETQNLSAGLVYVVDDRTRVRVVTEESIKKNAETKPEVKVAN